MSKKLKYLLLTLLFGLLIGIIGFFGIKYLIDNIGPERKEDPIPVVEEEVIDLDIEDYKVYETDNIGFNFVICRIHFKTNKDSLNYDLNRLSTDEAIKLGMVDSYIGNLEKRSYNLISEKISTEIKSDEKQMSANIFIPYTGNKTTLVIKDSKTSKEYTIDLTKNKGDINALINETGSNITGEDYEFYISNAFRSEMMLENNEEYSYPSTIQIYTFKVDVINAGNDIAITSATFKPNASLELYDALDGSYSNQKGYVSIINKNLSNITNGVLFFEIYNPEEDNITYDGYITLRLSNGETIEIRTEFN